MKIYILNKDFGIASKGDTLFYDEDVKVDFNIKNIMNRNYDIYSDTKGDSRNYMLNLSMIF